MSGNLIISSFLNMKNHSIRETETYKVNEQIVAFKSQSGKMEIFNKKLYESIKFWFIDFVDEN